MKFLHARNYDNSKCKRRLTPKWLIWTWCLQEEDLKDFLEEYKDGKWEFIDVQGKYLYAVDFRSINKFVCGISDFIPLIEPFKAEKHSINKVWDVEETHYYFTNPYAVIVSPIPLRRDALRVFWEFRKFIDEEWIKDLVEKRR